MAQPSMITSYQMSIPPFTPFTPAAYGRSSSPLNPQSHPPSSSPLTSPTPLPAGKAFRPFGAAHDGEGSGYGMAAGPSRASQIVSANALPLSTGSSTDASNAESSFMALYTPSLRSKRPPAAPRQSLPSHTLASRPSSHRARSSPTSPTYRMSSDIFSDSSSSSNTLNASAATSGPSPLQGQMWRDRLDRRMHERQRRTQARHHDLARRRGMSETDDMPATARHLRNVRGRGTAGSEEEWDEEAERQQAAEDEEVYRRLMLSQRRKAQHAAMVSYENETGGSDPLLPEFWNDGDEDEELHDESHDKPHHASIPLHPAGSTHAAMSHHIHPPPNAYQTPPRMPYPAHHRSSHAPAPSYLPHASIPDTGITAEAEAAEAAEAALAEQIEREMAEQAQPLSSRTSELGYDDDDMDVEYDWEALDQLEQAAAARQAGQPAQGQDQAQKQHYQRREESGDLGGGGDMDVDM